MASESHEQRLHAILHAYLQAVDRGERPDRQQLLNAHPDLRDELAEYFADASRLEKLAASMRTISLDGGSGSNSVGVLGKVRYFGDYELLEELARGGMGIVYKARQVSLDRVVALKMILKGEFASAADVERFRQEAQAAANLDHPNIVPIYEVGEYQGQHYFSMKLIATASKHRLTPGEAAGIVARAARAVHHAHQRGILHRDLKPGNVLVDQQGEPHVTDFGLAKRISGETPAVTHSGSVVGTPAYMPPEQALAEKTLTTAADVYGLGAILYEYLTGQPPFRGRDSLDTLRQVVEEEPVLPRLLKPDIARDLETICLKCLQKKPARRYASALELADDLDRWLRSEPIQARPVTWHERLAKWGRRRPALAALVLILLLGVPVALALITWQWREAVHQEREAHVQLARAERALYVNRIGRAYADWRDNELARGWAILSLCPESQRGWEWHYLDELCDSQQELQMGRDDRPYRADVAFSPDGQLIAAAPTDPVFAESDGPFDIELRLVRTPSMSPRSRLPDGSGWAMCSVAFSPDSKLLAVGGRLPGTTPEGLRGQGHIKVWDVDTEKVRYTITDHARGGVVEAVAFSPDGRFLATGSYHVVISDAATGKVVRNIATAARRLAFSPDSKSLAAISGQSMSVWEVETGRQLLSVTPELHGSTHWQFLNILFSSDGERLLTLGSAGVADVRFWGAKSGTPIGGVRGLDQYAHSIALSPDGRLLAVGCGNGTISLHDADTGEPQFTLRGHRGWVDSVAFSPQGNLLASGGRDRSLRLWLATRSHDVLILQNEPRNIAALALSDDGAHVAAIMGSKLSVWNSETGELLIEKADAVAEGADRNCIAFTPARQIAVAGPAGIRLWHLGTGKEEVFADKHSMRGLVFSPAGDRLLTIDSQSRGTLWDWKTKRNIKEVKRADGRPAFSTDGKRLAFLSGHRIQVLDATNAASLLSVAADTGFVTSLAFTADNAKLLAVDSSTRKVLVWDSATGRRLVDKPLAGSALSHVAIAPGAERLAYSHRSDELEIWDALAGEPVLVLKIPPHTSPGNIGSVVWSTGGSHVAAASSGGTIWVWEAGAANRLPLDDYFKSWHRRAAQESLRGRHWSAAIFHLNHALQADADNRQLHWQRGQAYAELGDWPRAAHDLEEYCESEDVSFDALYETALVQLAARVDARGTVNRLMQQWSATRDPRQARRLLQLWCLAPDAELQREQVINLVQTVLTRHQVVATIGSEIHPAKTYAEAARLLQNGKLASRPECRLTWPFLVIVCERLGDIGSGNPWRTQLIKQYERDRDVLVRRMNRQLAVAGGEDVGWQELLALDLLRSKLENKRGP